MFTVDENSAEFPGTTESVVSVLQSINEPKISAGDHPVEPTQAFVVVTSQGDRFEMLVVLYLTSSQKKVVYTWDEGVFAKKKRKEIESEALDFVEGMGFMMDNLNVEKLSPAEKQTFLSEIPIFVKGEEEPVALEPMEAEEAKIEDMFGEQEELTAEPMAFETDVRSAPKSPELASKDFDSSLQMMDEEFQREEDEFEDLNSIASMLEEQEPSPNPIPRPVAPVQVAPAVEPSQIEEPGNMRALLRLMSSL